MVLYKICQRILIYTIISIASLSWLVLTETGTYCSLKILSYLSGKFKFTDLHGNWLKEVEIIDLVVTKQISFNSITIKASFNSLDILDASGSIDLNHRKISIEKVSGKISYKRPNILIDINNLQGKYNGNKLQGNLKFSYSKSGYHIIKTKLQLSNNLIEFKTNGEIIGNIRLSDIFTGINGELIVSGYNNHGIQINFHSESINTGKINFTDFSTDMIVNNNKFTINTLFTNIDKTESFTIDGYVEDKVYFNFSRFPLSLLNLIQQKFNLEGNANSTITYSKNKLLAEIYLDEGNIAITSNRSIPIKYGKLNITHTKGNTQFNGNIISNLMEINSELQLAASGYKGDIYITSDNLANICDKLSTLDSCQGSISNHVSISGTKERPRLYLNSKLFANKLNIPKLGIYMNSISLSMQGELTDKIKINGLANNINIDGEAYLLESTYSINLTGTDVKLANTNDYQIIASPVISIKGIHDNLNISGKLNNVTGKIHLRDKTSSLQCSKDVVILDDTKTLDSIPNINANLKVEITNGELIAYGLESKVVGDLELGLQNQQYTASGKLQLNNGRYQLSGYSLHLNNSSISYLPGSSIYNPKLDLYLQSTDKKIALQVFGNINSLQVKETGLTGTEHDAFLQAFNASSTPILGKIQSSLALSEFGLQQNELNPISVDESVLNNKNIVIGKKLSNKVHLQYLKGLLENNQSVKLKYSLNDIFEVGLESNNLGNGADLSFTIED